MATSERRGAALACGAALLLCAVAAVGADRPSGKAYALIAGTVWTADNHAAAGIEVRLRRAGEKKVRGETRSDARGEFAFRVPAEPADYVVTAEPGGQRHPVEKTVRVEFDERTDIGLHLTE
jgi:hypothetical protein